MAAILCIPVVDGEAGKQAGAAPKAAFNASHLPECASTERVLCILDPRRALRREGLRAISLRTRGHDLARHSTPSDDAGTYAEEARDETSTRVAMFSPPLSSRSLYSVRVRVRVLCGHFDSSRRHLVRFSASSTVTRASRAAHSRYRRLFISIRASNVQRSRTDRENLPTYLRSFDPPIHGTNSK
ncbi:unnamed protein product [Xylocopa violacea]|uniref:Uncharacterized protein n=1 Tax=Xylocopa violacea TaxID=135666 RepID=A0ABP1NPU8_XYLVO